MKVHWFLGYYKNENSSKISSLKHCGSHHPEVINMYLLSMISLNNPTNRLIENARTNQVKVVFLI